MEIATEDNAATTTPAPSTAAAPGGRMEEPHKKQAKVKVIPEELFVGYAKRLGDVNDRKDRLAKCSRDLTSASKKLIFRALQSIPGSRPAAGSEKAVAQLLDMRKGLLNLFVPIEKELASAEGGSATYWHYNRQVSPGVQEFIESYTLLWYLMEGTLVTREAIQEAVHEVLKGALGTTACVVEITEEDYLLGVLDLTGEVMRHGVGASSADISVCEKDCAFVAEIDNAFNSVSLHGNEFKNKIGTLKNSLRKLEKVLYDYRLSHAETI